MLKDNIDEESEGNDYVLEEEEADQELTDDSDDETGEANDSTANGMYYVNFVFIINSFLKYLYRHEQSFSN